LWKKKRLKGVEMAVMAVAPVDAPPVRFEGRIWIRIGPRRGLASKQDERILDEKRRYRDLPFDIQPIPSSTLSDLDRVSFEIEYLRAVVASDVLEANDRSYEQKLASCRLIASMDDPTPTILGHMVIGIRPRDWLPGAYIQFLRFDGNDLAAPILDELQIDGTIGLILRGIDEKLKAHHRVAVDAVSGDLEKRVQAYPLAALQQFLRNAVMHRTYENTNAPVRIHWFTDRIEIWSPGGPYGIVTPENFGQPGYTDYRNPHLAEAMKSLGFVQRFGIGIQTARAELLKNGNPDPEFQISPAAVNVIVRAAM
jgi:ATP-dependent DNA helicase RecG